MLYILLSSVLTLSHTFPTIKREICNFNQGNQVYLQHHYYFVIVLYEIPLQCSTVIAHNSVLTD